jgi:hypothetical protein
VEPLGKVPDDDQVDIAPLVEVAAGERPVEDDGGDVPTRPDLPGKVPDLLDYPESERLAALQIESACSMHSSASSLSWYSDGVKFPTMLVRVACLFPTR